MTHIEAITELIRIWHSPHLDLSLKGNLGEVIEAVDVVRCKDCKNYNEVVEHDWERCRHFLAYVEPWDYCSYGERGDERD